MGAPDLFGNDPESIARLWDKLCEAMDRIGVLEAEVATLTSAKKKKPASDPSAGREVWERYAAAFERRYRAKPVRNAKVNGQLTQFVARVGAEDAPAVAEFFVLRCANSFYVQRMHSIDMLLRDAESVCASWKRGRGVTVTEARMTDETSQRGDAWGAVLAAARANHAT